MGWDLEKPVHLERRAWRRRLVTILLTPLVLTLSVAAGALDGIVEAAFVLRRWWRGYW